VCFSKDCSSNESVKYYSFNEWVKIPFYHGTPLFVQVGEKTKTLNSVEKGASYAVEFTDEGRINIRRTTDPEISGDRFAIKSVCVPDTYNGLVKIYIAGNEYSRTSYHKMMMDVDLNSRDKVGKKESKIIFSRGPGGHYAFGEQEDLIRYLNIPQNSSAKLRILGGGGVSQMQGWQNDCAYEVYVIQQKFNSLLVDLGLCPDSDDILLFAWKVDPMGTRVPVTISRGKYLTSRMLFWQFILLWHFLPTNPNQAP